MIRPIRSARDGWSGPSARARARGVRAVAGPALLGAVCLLPPWPAAGGEFAFGLQARSSAAPFSADDCRLTLDALQALIKDDLLAPLNLGLTVRDNVATLWGPVPSADLARRAEDVLRRVPGIGEVVNDLCVQPPDDRPDGGRAPSAGAEGEAPAEPTARQEQMPAMALEKAGPEPHSPAAALTGRLNEYTAAPAGTLLWRPARRQQAIPATDPLAGSEPAQQNRTTVATLRDADTSRPSLVIPSTGSLPRGAPAVLLPPVPMERPQHTLALAVDQLRQENVRFRGIQAETQGGMVRLRGTVHSWQDVYAFAKAVSLLPGVERVILDGVKAMHP